MAKDPYPTEMVHQWSTLEHQQRETEAAFARSGGRGIGSLLGTLFWLGVVICAASYLLPETGLWAWWEQIKLDAFASIGLKEVYGNAPILAPTVIIAGAWYGGIFARDGVVFPILNHTGLLGTLLLLPIALAILGVFVAFIVIGSVDGFIVVSDWLSTRS